MAGVGTTIDVAPFVGESRPADAATAAAVAEEWDQTFTSSGFAQIVGHGVDPALVAALRKAAADFFALPLEEKLAHQRELGNLAASTLGSYSPNSDVAPQLGDHDDPLDSTLALECAAALAQRPVQHHGEASPLPLSACRYFQGSGDYEASVIAHTRAHASKPREAWVAELRDGGADSLP